MTEAGQNLTGSIERQIAAELEDGSAAGAPCVFDYDNYRVFLNDYYHWKKRALPAFSYRYFSSKIGYSTSSFLKLVIQGKRNLTDDGIVRFAKALGLNTAETGFFRNLVLFNQTDVAEEKQRLAGEIVRSKGFKKHRPLDEAKFEYWSKWYYVAIRELVGVPGFQEDPQWIADHLTPVIAPNEAKASLEKLLMLGLLKRNEQGRLVQAQIDAFSGDDVVNIGLREFHRQMIQRGKDAVDLFSGSERQVSTVTFSLSAEAESKIREMINDFRQQICAVAEQDQNGERVMQVNFQLFPLSQRIKP